MRALLVGTVVKIKSSLQPIRAKTKLPSGYGYLAGPAKLYAASNSEATEASQRVLGSRDIDGWAMS